MASKVKRGGIAGLVAAALWIISAILNQMLIVAFPLGAVANAIFSSAEALLLALLWASMGVALLSRRQGVAEPVAAQPGGTG
jgi:hypothetical protein